MRLIEEIKLEYQEENEWSSPDDKQNENKNHDILKEVKLEHLKQKQAQEIAQCLWGKYRNGSSDHKLVVSKIIAWKVRQTSGSSQGGEPSHAATV